MQSGFVGLTNISVSAGIIGTLGTDGLKNKIRLWKQMPGGI